MLRSYQGTYSMDAETKETIIKAAVYRSVSLAREIAEHDFVNKPEIVETRRKSSVAGRAIGGEIVELNMRLIQTEDQLREVLYHELAHIVCFHCYGGKVHHGPKWKEVMKKLGRDPKRTHTLDLVTAMPDRWTSVVCENCQKQIAITRKKAKHLSDYFCARCGGGLKAN